MITLGKRAREREGIPPFNAELKCKGMRKECSRETLKEKKRPSFLPAFAHTQEFSEETWLELFSDKFFFSSFFSRKDRFLV